MPQSLGRPFSILVLILSFNAVRSIAFAQDPPAPLAPRPKVILFDALKDVGALPSLRTAVILGAGGAAALAVHPADRNINRQVRGSDYGFLVPGRTIGNAGIQLGVAAGTYLVSYAVTGREGAAARLGAELVRAQLVTQALTIGIKAAARRDRPDGRGRLSFPSGHSSTTFATATVLASHFGWRVATPSYLVATYVASSRLHDNRHNASGAVFGAALGIAVGQTVRARRKSSVAVQPIVLAGGAGLLLEW